jgi:cytidine deaminase
VGQLSSSDLLIEAARRVQANAYAPYSNYAVGAALQCEDGSVFVGCNVENASYGLTNCAERVAIAAAVSQGQRRFRRIVIVSNSDPPAAPCGACRQVLREFSRDLEVHAVGPKRTLQWKLTELLPAAFGPEQLDGTRDS